jgi:hypothetical protein
VQAPCYGFTKAVPNNVTAPTIMYPKLRSGRALSGRQLQSVVRKYLPIWAKAAEKRDGSSIVLHEAAFGTSPRELLLLAAAIKYAAANGKHVHIVYRYEEPTAKPATLETHTRAGAIIREAPLVPETMRPRRNRGRRVRS